MSSFTTRLSSALQQPVSSGPSSATGEQPSKLAKKSQQTSLLDRPLLSGLLGSRKTSEAPQVSLSAFSFIFSEMVQYTQKRVTGIPELEDRLSDFGRQIGWRLLELINWREFMGSKVSSSGNVGKRELKHLQMLMFLNTTVWKALFGKQADSLERSTDNEDEYMISDNEPLVIKYISVPKDLSQLNCCAFVAGIVESILESAQFPSRVTAHSTPIQGFPLRTTILIKFDKTVMEREKMFSEGR